MSGRLAVLACATLAACSFDPSGAGGGGGGGGNDGGGGGSSDGGGGVRSDGGGGGEIDGGGVGTADAGSLDASLSATARIDCSPTVVPPNIDGARVGPWLSSATFTTFAVADAELRADVNNNYVDSASVEFACMHDDNNVYFYLDVTDDDLQDNSLSLREDDAVVVFLDGNGDRSGGYGVDDHAIAFGAEGDTVDYAASNATGSFARVFTAGGYAVEVELDKPSLSDTLATELGFNIAIVDDDGLSNNDRDLFALRHVPESQAPACPNCCEGQAAPWCDTRVMGVLVLE